jgi:hypothetical protein
LYSATATNALKLTFLFLRQQFALDHFCQHSATVALPLLPLRPR